MSATWRYDIFMSWMVVISIINIIIVFGGYGGANGEGSTEGGLQRVETFKQGRKERKFLSVGGAIYLL